VRAHVDTRSLLLAEPGVELAHTRFQTVLAAKSDRPHAHKVADHDPAMMMTKPLGMLPSAKISPNGIEQVTAFLQEVARQLAEKRKAA
jgi:hypothetical protein